MKRLYDLNKDELIMILTNVVKNLSDEELEEELRRRKDYKKLEMLKTNLLNLKAIPHLTDFIVKHKEYIKSRTNIKNFYDNSKFKEESKTLSLCKNEDNEDETNLCKDIETFIREWSMYSWIHDNDEILYESCEKCDYYAIRFYKGSLSSTTMYKYGTSPLCSEHFRHGYEGYF